MKKFNEEQWREESKKKIREGRPKSAISIMFSEDPEAKKIMGDSGLYEGDLEDNAYNMEKEGHEMPRGQHLSQLVKMIMESNNLDELKQMVSKDYGEFLEQPETDSEEIE